MNIRGRYTISETAFRRYTDAYTSIIFKILCFQYFIILGFYLPGISKCCYVYYSIPNLYFSISLLSNERVPQFNLLIQSMQSNLLLTCIYFSYYIFHLIVVFLVIFHSCSTYYHYLISLIFIMPYLNYWLSFQVFLLQIVFTFSFEAVFRYPTTLYESKFS